MRNTPWGGSPHLLGLQLRADGDDWFWEPTGALILPHLGILPRLTRQVREGELGGYLEVMSGAAAEAMDGTEEEARELVTDNRPHAIALFHETYVRTNLEISEEIPLGDHPDDFEARLLLVFMPNGIRDYAGVRRGDALPTVLIDSPLTVDAELRDMMETLCQFATGG